MSLCIKGTGDHLCEGRAPAEEGFAVRIVGKDNAPFTSSPHHVVEGSWGVEANPAGHTGPPVVEYGRYCNVPDYMLVATAGMNMPQL